VIPVTFDQQDINLAKAVAQARMESAIADGRKDYHGVERNFETDYVGCCGEIAVAKWRNVYWNGGIGRAAPGDIAPRVEVKATLLPHGRLPVYRDSPQTSAFILTTVTLPTVNLIGWAWAKEAKRPEWWRTDLRAPCYLVPQHRLRPMIKEDIQRMRLDYRYLSEDQLTLRLEDDDG
jgi:hypothetical protein